MKNLLKQEFIQQQIFFVRNEKIMIDADLAKLYGVSTKVLIQAVKRNETRFPKDFMFQLTKTEFQRLRSQFVTSKRGGRRYLPYAFTEQGVAMLSSVLNSERAVQVNIAIMRAFVKMRMILSTHKELAEKLVLLERKIEHHDSEIQDVFSAIRQLMTVHDEPKRKKVGFLK